MTKLSMDFLWMSMDVYGCTCRPTYIHVHTQIYIQRIHTQYEYLRQPKFRWIFYVILSKSVATLDMSEILHTCI